MSDRCSNGMCDLSRAIATTKDLKPHLKHNSDNSRLIFSILLRINNQPT